MILATFNCFQIPFDVAFQPEFFQTLSFTMINSAIDLCFLADIFVSFRTTYINEKTGAEVKNLKDLAKFYLKG